MALEQHAKGSFDDLNDYDEQQLRSILNEAVDSEDVNYELIKRITDVLAAKTNEKPIDVEFAYKQFISQYADSTPLYSEVLREVGDLESGTVFHTSERKELSKHPKHVVHFSRAVKTGILVAAVLALFLATAVVANAFGFSIWNANVSWNQDNMGISTVNGETEIISEDPYTQIRNAIRNENVQESVIPTYLPYGYSLKNLSFLDSFEGHTYNATFQSGETSFRLTIVVQPTDINMFCPKDDSEPEIYTVNGIEHYLTTNEGHYRANWANGDVVCELYGLESKEELLRIIDSIYKE